MRVTCRVEESAARKCEWKKVFPVGTWRGDPKYSNSYQLIPVHRQMMAVEAVKEKFYCFLGIVHPTYYQSRGWGTWLPPHTPLGKMLNATILLPTFCVPHVYIGWGGPTTRLLGCTLSVGWSFHFQYDGLFMNLNSNGKCTLICLLRTFSGFLKPFIGSPGSGLR